MSDKICQYCHLNPAGNHAPDCPCQNVAFANLEYENTSLISENTHLHELIDRVIKTHPKFCNCEMCFILKEANNKEGVPTE